MGFNLYLGLGLDLHLCLGVGLGIFMCVRVCLYIGQGEDSVLCMEMSTTYDQVINYDEY